MHVTIYVRSSDVPVESIMSGYCIVTHTHTHGPCASHIIETLASFKICMGSMFTHAYDSWAEHDLSIEGFKFTTTNHKLNSVTYMNEIVVKILDTLK